MKRLKMVTGYILILMLLLTGCSKGGQNSTTEKNLENATGRYLEEEYELPQDVGAVLDIGTLSDGTLRLIGTSALYESSDGGATWEKASVQPDIYEEASAYEYMYLTAASMDENGNMFFICMGESASGRYVYVDQDNNQKGLELSLPELDFAGYTVSNAADEDALTDETNMDSQAEPIAETENVLMKAKFTSDGKLLGTDIMGAIYLIDPNTGEIIHTFEDQTDTSVSSFTGLGNKLLITHKQGVDIYDLDNAKLLDEETALSEYFHSGVEADGSVTITMESGDDLLIEAVGEDTVYFCDKTGLYRYTLGSSAVESVINGSLTSMSNQEYYFTALVPQEDDTFLVAYTDMNGTPKLMHYEYSADVSTVPDKELTIYSLEDNQNIRQAISKFQSDNPDIYVNLEIGMSGENATTVSDAITTLNTNIMAGNGPDIIVLDGMPIDSYIEKGLLADLSDTVTQTSLEYQLFEDVLYTNQTDDGLYAIPTRFAVPMIWGKADDLSAVTNLSSLADTVEIFRKDNADLKSILGTQTAEDLTKLLLSTSSPAIMNTDGTVNEEALKDFLTQIKRIYDANGSGESTDQAHSLGGSADFLTAIAPMLSEPQKFCISNISSLTDLNILFSASKELDMDYQLLNTLSAKVYIPMDSVGISAKSELLEESKAFVKAMLSLDYQKVSLSGGFPVNLDAYDESCSEALESEEEMAIALGYSITDENGEMSTGTLMIQNGTEEEYTQFKESFLSLDKAAVTNDILIDAIVEGAAKHLSGGASLDEAASSILQTVNLYLSE